MLDAAELLRRGRLSANRGAFPRARHLLDLASRRTDDPDLLAQIETTTGYVDAESGAIDLALDRFDGVLNGDAATALTRSLALSQRALLHLRRGEHELAQADFDSAEDGLRDHPEPLGRLHLNRGLMFMQAGRLERAAEDLRVAVDVLESTDATQLADKAGFNLAYVSLLQGDLVAALQGMDHFGKRLAESGPVNAAVFAQDRAEALLAAGLAEEAERSLGEAARAYAVRRLGQFQAEAELVRARTLLRVDEGRAAKVGRRAARIFRGRGAESFALRADLVVLTAQVQAGRRTASLVDQADTLAADLAAAGLRQESTLAALQAVRVLLGRGALEEASTRLRGTKLRADDRMEIRLLDRELRADLASARGQRRRALTQVRAGLAELHDWQSSFGSLDLQSTAVGHGQQLAVQGLREARATGDPETLLEWSERARALVARVTPVRPPADPELAAQLADLRVLLSRHPEPGSADARRVARLRESIRQRSWYGTGSRAVTEPATTAELQDRLKTEDAALVAHVVVDDDLVAVVATPEGVHVRELGPRGDLTSRLTETGADLDVAASELPAPIREVVLDGLRRHLAVLDERLLAPVADLLGERRLLLTPSSGLAGAPWTLLPSLAGRPLAVPRSATHWLGQPARAGTGAPLVGFVAGPNVARAGREVELSAAGWPADRVLQAPAATSAEVVALADRVDVLHVAAHGRHSAETPLFSGLELEDGAFYGYDIDQVAAVPETVLLSACELGRGSVRAAEETVGMTAAWLHAGARCVVASPTAISDEAACDVLAKVHAGLAAGSAPAEALADALVTDGDATPAPLICFGAGW